MCNRQHQNQQQCDDNEQCKELVEKGMDVIILDHHICDKQNDFAIVVNNQMCDYTTLVKIEILFPILNSSI